MKPVLNSKVVSSEQLTKILLQTPVEDIVAARAQLQFYIVQLPTYYVQDKELKDFWTGIGIIEVDIEILEDINYSYWIFFSCFKGLDINIEKEFHQFVEYGLEHIEILGKVAGITIKIERKPHMIELQTDNGVKWFFLS